LFGMGARDPLTFAAIIALLAVVGFAAWAWRATRVDPLVALRTE
jgi:HAMP domain-containing protein